MKVVEKEYEIKIAVKDLGDVERALREIGAVLEDDVYEEDHYIDLRPCKDLRSTDEVLRIRISRSSKTNSEFYELTYKGPRTARIPKVRDEISVEVSDGRALLEIIRRLGFLTYVLKKRRKIYRYGKYKIFLDDVVHLGKYIEVEVEGVSSVEEFNEEIKKLVSILRLSGPLISKSYLELILEKLGQ